jgi:hypothetical protein
MVFMNGITEKEDGFIFETALFLDENVPIVNNQQKYIIQTSLRCHYREGLIRQTSLDETQPPCAAEGRSIKFSSI